MCWRDEEEGEHTPTSLLGPTRRLLDISVSLALGLPGKLTCGVEGSGVLVRKAPLT
jgi:hypothetical protein